ncbi:hypothetical protein AGMMS50229_05990 [Campylobacterota bacterium]|nr:hypothetical protein AGMMS50229_05990 [Campylobacterota bacterium]
MLDLIVSQNAKDSVFIPFSSAFVYGNTSKGNIKENDYQHFEITSYLSAYIEAKRAAETLSAAYSKQYGIKTVFPRFSGAFGSGAEEQNTAIGSFFSDAIYKRDIVMKSDGQDKGDYCYLSDSVTGLFYCLFYGQNSEAYNIANTECFLSRLEFVEKIADIAKVGIVRNVETALKPTIARGARFDNTKLRALGWKPKVSPEDGIERLIRSVL